VGGIVDRAVSISPSSKTELLMRFAILSLLLGAMPYAATGAQPAAGKPTIVVVCPKDFRPAMRPWVEARSEQNKLEFLSNSGSAKEIRQEIRRLAKKANLQAIVLVGDAPTKGAKAAHQTPAFVLPGKVNVHWGGDEHFATDNPYADLDDDGLPDVAIGRLPADNVEELKGMIGKILKYEDNKDFGLWRTRINLVAGEGGFGAALDGAIESAARQFITWGVPAPYRTTMTYASWRSPYCPDPKRFHACCLERLNEGCLFWVYIGHGSRQLVKQADFPDGSQPILSCIDCGKLDCGDTPPIAMFLACHTGAFAASSDCLAEELLRAPGGPVAIISGSNVTMPYAMAALGREAMRECFENRRETVGELLLHAKRNTANGYGSPFWSFVNALTATVSPESFQPKQERREHLQLFNLFGDPTMKLHAPKPVPVKAPAKADAGQAIKITGDSPINGNAEIELVVRRDRFRREPKERRVYRTGEKARAEYDATYRAANDPVLATVKLPNCKGKFAVQLTVPADAVGTCHVRVFVSGEKGYAIGATDIEIHGPGGK
jgi:hypothetical protein